MDGHQAKKDSNKSRVQQDTFIYDYYFDVSKQVGFVKQTTPVRRQLRDMAVRYVCHKENAEVIEGPPATFMI